MNPSQTPGDVVSVAVEAPLYRLFDYLAPTGCHVTPRCRVLVPFGASRRVGFVVSRAAIGSDVRELKQIIKVVDTEPLFDRALGELLAWAAEYYQHPLGEVMQAALPTRLRRLQTPPPEVPRYALAVGADEAIDALPRNASRQRRVVERVAAAGAGGIDRGMLRADLGDIGAALGRLESRGVLQRVHPDSAMTARPGPALNTDQRGAVDAVDAAGGRFACFLLRGVTGSGKTEVYLECTRRAIARGHQVLVLVPEIALTPQLVARFRERLARPVAVLHSGLADGDRQRAWLAAAGGEADVVLGTRSAVLTPLARPGLVIVDEEHDPSFKQQEGFRYNARDVAIKRAALHRVPVVLGSATPSLESHHNAARGRYRLLTLPERAGAATLPEIRLVDTRRWPLADGLSQPLAAAVGDRIARGEQTLIFINRRGFAPVVMCGSCGWQARCARCDAFMTLHREKSLLRCHHCGASRRAESACPGCGGDDIFFAGVGTQRVEQALKERFPEARILRIDRDTSSARGALESHLEQVRRGEVDILVGTQLLSKGHDFPGITLVGVLNGDQGMYSVDFRAAERLFQTVTQVAGRAGRGARRGLVLMQTRFADHPSMQAIVNHDYEAFAAAELASRHALGLPPFSYLALFRAESVHETPAIDFLRGVQAAGRECAAAAAGVEVMDPVPAPMERRAGRFRAQLMIEASRRPPLGRLLHELVRRIEGSAAARRVRWSLDVDPVDLY